VVVTTPGEGGKAVSIGGPGMVSTGISGLVSVTAGTDPVLSEGGGAITGDPVEESGTP
jgi:hypothetical protein